MFSDPLQHFNRRLYLAVMQDYKGCYKNEPTKFGRISLVQHLCYIQELQEHVFTQRNNQI